MTDMAQTLTRLLVHVVFSTHDRRNLITPEIEPTLHSYLAGTCRNMESPSLAVNGTENHIHLLISLSKNIALADLLMNVKKDSSKWTKTQGHDHRDFHWQDGYGGFSVGESQVPTVIEYIRTQKEHHEQMFIEDELIKLAQRYGVQYDPKYIWT